MILIVKSLPDLARVGCAVALTGLLGACGQKGPLFLPPKPAPAIPATPALPAMPTQTMPADDNAPAGTAPASTAPASQ